MTRYLISFDAHAMDHIPAEDMPAVATAAHEVVAEADALTAPPRPGRSGFAAGFLTDILNPKVGV